MSQKIEDVLQVLTLIRPGFHRHRPRSHIEARIRAIRQIAKERGVAYQTIGDAYLRRLEPEIKGTAAFDVLVREWLTGASNKLERILVGHALDHQDQRNIVKFFA